MLHCTDTLCASQFTPVQCVLRQIQGCDLVTFGSQVDCIISWSTANIQNLYSTICWS